MDKIKRFFLDLPFRMSIILYIIAFALAAIMLSVFTTHLSQKVIDKTYASYSIESERYYVTTESGEIIDRPIVGIQIQAYENTESLFSESDRRLIAVFEIIIMLCVPVYSALCLITAILLFYRNKMRKPLTILQEAYHKIYDENLDFTINYTSKDEMGELCKSFEKMRASLLENNRKMWRQMEERKRLNAAFAHDLRTPLTVLKGYSEMQRLENGASEIASSMLAHINRLERYVEGMSNLQKLEDISLNCVEINLSGFLLTTEQTAKFICKNAGKRLSFQNRTSEKTAYIDTEIISQVVENLVSNASRYAKSEIEIETSEFGGILRITVMDDGEGFSSESLQKATEPYYSGDANKAVHFGLGLYICKVLCKHHGGNVQIQNTERGGQAIASFRIMTAR